MREWPEPIRWSELHSRVRVDGPLFRCPIPAESCRHSWLSRCGERGMKKKAQHSVDRHPPWLQRCRPFPAACETTARWAERNCDLDRKSTRLNSSHANISFAVF